MSLLASAPSVGAQQPRVCHYPDYVSSTGQEAVELVALAGLEMDPWQEMVIHHGLGERPDGQWSAFEVGLEVPRQNGKGGVLECRELAGLFLLGEELIVHSAHEFATAEEALERMAILIEGCADFSRRVRTIKRSHGQEGIYLTNGQRLRYRTRTKGGGRGLSADCVVLDEAMHIPEAMLNALFPTLSARENPQLWYTGSAVDQETMENGIVFSRLRQRGMKGGDPKLAYFGWSPEFDSPDEIPDESMADPGVWAQANPALGIRITEDYIAGEQRSMSARGFAVERLNVGDWPDPDEDDSPLIPTWDGLEDLESGIDSALRFAYDISPARTSAAICAAGKRKDGLFHVEVIEHRRGTSWVADGLAALSEKYGTPVACDERGPAGSLLQELRDSQIAVEPLNGSEYSQACGFFFDACGVEEDDEPTLRHLGTTELSRAVRGVAQRPLGDAWAWSRKQSSVDITPLAACTAALWRASKVEQQFARAQW